MGERGVFDPQGRQVMMRNDSKSAGYFFSPCPAETVKNPTNI